MSIVKLYDVNNKQSVIPHDIQELLNQKEVQAQLRDLQTAQSLRATVSDEIVVFFQTESVTNTITPNDLRADLSIFVTLL